MFIGDLAVGRMDCDISNPALYSMIRVNIEMMQTNHSPPNIWDPRTE